MQTLSLWQATNEDPIGTTVNALRSIRSSFIRDEKAELHQIIADSLNTYGIAYQHEYKLGSHCRIDFMTSDGVGIEAKKGKPNSRSLQKQLERYAAFDVIRCIILIIETSIDLPLTINNKPLKVVSLYKQWGIAL